MCVHVCEYTALRVCVAGRTAICECTCMCVCTHVFVSRSEGLTWVSVRPRGCDRAGWCPVGRDRSSSRVTLTPCPVVVASALLEAWLGLRGFWTFEKAASRPLVVTQTDPLGGEETRAFGGSRGPNSVTRSLRSFSTVNPTLWGWAGCPVAPTPTSSAATVPAPPLPCPPSGCGERPRKGALERNEGPQASGSPNQREGTREAYGWIFFPFP